MQTAEHGEGVTLLPPGNRPIVRLEKQPAAVSIISPRIIIPSVLVTNLK